MPVNYFGPEGETQEEKFKRLKGIIDNGGAIGGKELLLDDEGRVALDTIAAPKQPKQAQADNNAGFLGEIVDSYKQSELYAKFMTEEEKLRRAREINKATGIPEGAILTDEETFKRRQKFTVTDKNKKI